MNNQKLFGENVVKELGEVCQIKSGNHSTKKCNFIEGEYLIIGGGKQPIGKHNEYNCDEITILCASHGTAGYISMYPVKTFLTMAFAFIENKQLINKIYLYYYLKSIEEHLISLGKGTAQPCISMEKLKSIKIPIPSLEHQKKIIKYLDFIYEKTNKTSLEKIQELKMLNELCLNNQKMYGDNLIKTLGEVCKVNQGTYIKPDMKIQGEYPVYGGGNASYYINQYNREDDIIVAKDGVSTDCVRYEKNKFFLNHHGWTLICKEQIIKKYMFYYLQLI